VIDVDPQQLAHQRDRDDARRAIGQGLGVAGRIVRAAAIAGADVEHPVEPELDHAAVVVRERVADREDLDAARSLREVWIARRRLASRDHVTELERRVRRLAPRVIDEELTIRVVLRVEREPQQALLATGQHRSRVVVGEIQKRSGAKLLVLDDADRSIAGDHEQSCITRW
jgi:hypothetical protein